MSQDSDIGLSEQSVAGDTAPLAGEVHRPIGHAAIS
jgi:hypothetical protein